jgi:hypothetical protein
MDSTDREERVITTLEYLAAMKAGVEAARTFTLARAELAVVFANDTATDLQAMLDDVQDPGDLEPIREKVQEYADVVQAQHLHTQNQIPALVAEILDALDSAVANWEAPDLTTVERDPDAS